MGVIFKSKTFAQEKTIFTKMLKEQKETLRQAKLAIKATEHTLKKVRKAMK